MNQKRLIFAVIGAFIFIFIFEMLWHGFLMKGMYEATASVWKPQEEANMALMTLSQFLSALVLTVFYSKVGKHLSCQRGILFGLFAGLIIATPELAASSYLPIPFALSAMWMAASILKCVGAGMIIAKIYK